MKRRTSLALLVLMFALPAFGKETVFGTGLGCPAARGATESTAGKGEEKPKAPASTESAPSGANAESNGRDRPRWHSFIPGMMR